MLNDNYRLTRAQLVELMLCSGLLAGRASDKMKFKYKAKIESIIGRGELVNVMIEGRILMSKNEKWLD